MANWKRKQKQKQHKTTLKFIYEINLVTEEKFPKIWLSGKIQDTSGIVIVLLKMEWDDLRTTHPCISGADWKSRFSNSNLLSDIPGRNTETYFHRKFMAP